MGVKRNFVVILSKNEVVMMKKIPGKSLKCFHRFWSTQTAEREKRNVLSCGIWYLSTGEQESQRRTAPMIPTFTSSATRQG